MRKVVADEADDDGVPDDGGRTRKRIEKMKSEMRLTFAAEFAET